MTEAISLKNAAQYEVRLLTRDRVDSVMKQVERFLQWAEEGLPP